MVELIDFANSALAIPFLEKGRDYDGVDCWGLVYLCYRDVYGIELPTYIGDYRSSRRRQELRDLIAQRRLEKWILAPNPRVGDVALLRIMGRECHVGIMVGTKRMLHIEDGLNVAVEDITRAPWKGPGFDKVEGIYCHVDRE